MKSVLASFSLISFFCVGAIIGCTAQQKASFAQALTGSPTTQPSQNQPMPTPSSIEGITGTIATGAGTVAAATAGTPVSGIAVIVAAVASGLLAVERLALALGLSLPNSKSSRSQLSSASAGGSDSGTGPQLPSAPLKAA